MSYLTDTRISFRGRFLSDVSTNNNIATNYRDGAAQQHLWNTMGGAAVELLDCGVLLSGAVALGDPAADFVITGAVDRPSGKMVDLDPDMQSVSEFWGMQLRISHRETGALALQGRMAVCAFRDLWSRQISPALNGQALGARFVSVLEELEWGPAAEGSAAMQALRDQADEGRLSVGLHTFGYFYNQQHPRYRTGTIMVNIGPWKSGEPKTALVHRRLLAATVGQTGGGNFDLTGDIDFALSDGGRRLHLDLGHALRLADVDGWQLDYRYMPPPVSGIARMSIGLLPAGGAAPDPNTVVEFLDLPIPDLGWYRRTGGVMSVDIPAAHVAAAETTPFALFAQVQGGGFFLLSQETENGIFYRADDFVRRLETGATAEVALYAQQFGKPLAGLQLHTVLSSSSPGPTQNSPNTPVPPQPTLSSLAPTDADGKTLLTLTGVDPGNPRARNDLDGAIFLYAYGHKLGANGQLDQAGNGLGGLDAVVIHGRDPYTVPQTPNFTEHVYPIMTQYAQLYPIMSEHLFKLDDYAALVKHRRALLLAFSRDLQDPNYMPVTRDLSDGRMATLVKWLSTETGDPDAPLVRGPEPAPVESPAMAAALAEAAPPAPAEDAKTMAERMQRLSAHRKVVPAEMLEG